MPPVLHFGYFDHAALTDGRLRPRHEPAAGRLLSTLNELFDPLPGRDMPGLGFFDFYGILSCECPSVVRSVRLPASRIEELVDRSECDVVYAYNGEFYLVPRGSLSRVLDPHPSPQ